MLARDQVKVLQAGFMIIREREDVRHEGISIIVVKTNVNKEWRNLKTGFKSKAARRREMDRLLKDRMVIED